MKEIYHNLKNYMLTALLVLSSSACGSHGNEQSGTDNSDTPAPSKTSFTQGADISWVSEMEKKGLKFYNHEGIETDCFQLMKELGINAIRLRVWVNPKDRWNSKQDVVNKARRAKEQGLDVMVDFHYSDSWADPGQQFKPKAWIGKSVAELKTAIAAHTIDILQALKAEDISPRWVQVGNEIRPGMLWDENVALSGAFYDIRECDVKGSHIISVPFVTFRFPVPYTSARFHVSGFVYKIGKDLGGSGIILFYPYFGYHDFYLESLC